MSSPKLSVITVSHNRRELLLRKAASLCAQTLAPEAFEWVVCLNGDVDGSQAALAQLKLPFAVKVVAFAVQQSASRARNACAALAEGGVLYFSDDDCLPAPATLAQHLAAQQTPCAAIGPILFDDGARRELWRPRRPRYWNFNGANSSAPKAAFAAVGGFDERLSGYGGEDLLLGYQLYRAGLPFVAVDAEVTHLGPNPMRAPTPEKARSAGANAARIASWHPELAFRLGVHPLLVAVKRRLVPLLRRFSDRWEWEWHYLQGVLSSDAGDDHL